MLFTKNSDQETLKISFVAISFNSNLRLTGLVGLFEECLCYLL